MWQEVQGLTRFKSNPKFAFLLNRNTKFVCHLHKIPEVSQLYATGLCHRVVVILVDAGVLQKNQMLQPKALMTELGEDT